MLALLLENATPVCEVRLIPRSDRFRAGTLSERRSSEMFLLNPVALGIRSAIVTESFLSKPYCGLGGRLLSSKGSGKGSFKGFVPFEGDEAIRESLGGA